MLFAQLEPLDLQIEAVDLELRERETSSEFTRTSTIVSLHGDGKTGRGEDVIYDNEPHYRLVENDQDIPVTGSYTFGEFSDRIGELDLFFGREPKNAVFRNYRQWAVESAALDLALKQAETNLAAHLDLTYSPVRFIVSTRLGDPPTDDRITALLEENPDLFFKLDPTDDWSGDLVERLADTGAVRILDLKGKYEGTDVDQTGDPDLYELILDGFPDAVIEDPDLNEQTRPLFEGNKDRVSWDYPIRSVATVEELPWEPEWLNIKPSRFGSVESLFETVEYCNERDIRLYGGGQFELGVGREHLHALASLFYPDSPNDVAPRGYNEPELDENLPTSPLAPPEEPAGLDWPS